MARYGTAHRPLQAPTHEVPEQTKDEHNRQGPQHRDEEPLGQFGFPPDLGAQHGGQHARRHPQPPGIERRLSQAAACRRPAQTAEQAYQRRHKDVQPEQGEGHAEDIAEVGQHGQDQQPIQTLPAPAPCHQACQQPHKGTPHQHNQDQAYHVRRTLIDDDDRHHTHQEAGGHRPLGDKPPVVDVLQLWTVTDEDERQQEREHPLEDHEPSVPGHECRVWPGDLDQAGVEARPERGGHLRTILRRDHRGGGISQGATLCERDQIAHRGGQCGDPGVERPGVLLDGQQGPELVPEQTEGGLDRSLGFGYRGGEGLKRLIVQHSRVPGVPPLLFSHPLFSPVPEGPYLVRHELTDLCQGITRALDLCFELRQSAPPRASGGLPRQELLGRRVHAGADVLELLLHPSESHPVCQGSFEAGEAVGHGRRQGDDLGQLRDPRRRCGCRRRGLRDQSPRCQHEREEHQSLDEALERDVHTLPP